MFKCWMCTEYTKDYSTVESWEDVQKWWKRVQEYMDGTEKQIEIRIEKEG